MASWLDEEREWVAHLPEFYANFLLSCCDTTGLSADGINLVATLVLSSVFAWFWQYQYSPLHRQLTSTLFSLAVLYVNYGPKSSLAVIAIVAAAYPVFQTRDVMLISLYAWAQLFLVFIYFWWFYCGSFRMDISATTMGLLIRFIFIAYDQQDMDIYNKKQVLSKSPKIKNFRMEHKLDREVGFYDFFSYQICFLHLFAGSNMTTMDYFRLIELRQFEDFDNIPRADLIAILKQIGRVLLSAVLYIVVSINIFSMQRVDEDWFLESNVFFRATYIVLSIVFVKQRYHLIWHLVELPVLTSGAAYSGKDKDGNNQWERHKNINSWKAEFGEKEIYLTFNWNMTVNLWLKHYFLDRLEDSGLSFDMKLLLTRAAGSLFHGVYTGPHVFFFFTVLHSLFFSPILNHYIGVSRDYKSEAKKWAVYLFRGSVNSWLMHSYGVPMVWFQAKDWIAINHIQMWAGYIILVVSVFVKIAFVDPDRRRMKKLRSAKPVGGLKVD